MKPLQLEKRSEVTPHVTRDVTCVLSIMTRTGTMMTKSGIATMWTGASRDEADSGRF